MNKVVVISAELPRAGNGCLRQGFTCISKSSQLTIPITTSIIRPHRHSSSLLLVPHRQNISRQSPTHILPPDCQRHLATMSTLEDLDAMERDEKEEKKDKNDGGDGKDPKKPDGPGAGGADTDMKDAEEEKKDKEDDIIDLEILSSSTRDIINRRRLIEGDMKVMRSEFQRLTHEQNTMKEKIKDNQDKIENNR